MSKKTVNSLPGMVVIFCRSFVVVYDRTTNTNIDISNIYYRYHLAKGTARYDVFGASLTHR